MKRLYCISGSILVILSILSISSCKKDEPEPPTVSTIAVTSVSFTTAASGGNVTDEGGATVIEKGVCWNIAGSPTISNSKTSDGAGSGAFASNITQLTPSTQYYIRAYATNSAGTGYGNEVSFTTIAVTAPEITTTAITSITESSAVSGGNVTSENGGSVTAKGVCWSTTANSTIEDSKTTDGTGTGSFVSNITDLLPGTTYYVKAYATNSAGTGYGAEVSFTTDQYPRIRIKTGTGLNYGASIYFVALSKDVNYFDLTTDEKFAYDKTEADWYIDGGIIPFTTNYKEFTLTLGTYYFLMRGSGTVVVTTKTISDCDQTFVISGTTYGGITITTTYPKKAVEAEQSDAKQDVYFAPGQTEYIIQR